MTTEIVYDLVVIGGGPAGYVGALRAAQLGKKVACVEAERAGGTCLNWGCIPTKSLLKNAELYHLLRHRADAFGLSFKDLSIDFSKVMARSRSVSDQMARGIEYLFSSKKVDLIRGTGQIQPDKKVIVREASGSTKTISARNILVATGAVARTLPGLKIDNEKIITSRQALALQKCPKSIVILGAGAIGVEFAYFFNAMGAKVTLVEMMPKILPIEDEEVSDFLAKSLSKEGIEILTESKFESAEVLSKGVKVKISPINRGGQARVIEADSLLLAIGLEPNLKDTLGAGVKLELDAKGYVRTDEKYQTSILGVYAAGDIIGPPWLAHVASHEAIEAVEGMFIPGKKPHKVYTFPSCTYCQPQVASVGLTERKAREAGLKFKLAKFPYKASGRAVASGEAEGFVKLITGEKHGEILGAHIIGSEASELIAEMGLAMSLEATTDEIISTIHAHPTLSEMIAEAALVARGTPLHI